ncbi:MAG: cob(I)yrinic acid a,c-diamide adenosyltransferase [Bacteroidota bacterium]|nr:cob(I)yrinic acid a,c-diamide adenosyltransferase [Bacteroidota bacterium]MDP4232775.1 cob(I)yrinic acid a,c-diamide adenosyltransferase [Bacteroidota bacterium]MDP4242543.1 cob(I)yrinic acid a,c-diamide adenosyltransferase [Bacteroidota bacterium]MDP4288878.1 cob(I)yrinic acid a,c-diamide adenosyltransferase [Bacteroidota bacterium]
MKIYTKTGDDGTTGLFGGGRVPKDSPRIEAYGTVDELNSCIGLVRAASGELFVDLLQRISEELFVLGGDLATPLETRSDYEVPRIGESQVRALELAIDEHDAQLPSLKRFILPGGTPLAAHLHHARTVCRRAERLLVTLTTREKIGPNDIIYLNRLSDLLFVLARRANQLAGVRDIEWAGAAATDAARKV